METKESLWKKCLEKIEAQILPENYNTWFSPTYPHALDAGQITIAVPNFFFKKCLRENYQDLIENALETVSEDKLLVDFYIDSSREHTPEPAKVAEPIKTVTQPLPKENLEEKPSRITLETPISSSINPKYTFSSFVVGSNNQFANAAAQAVASNPAMAYNPLFLYGAVGLGKTHLLHAIGNVIIERNPDARVRYLSAESFTVDLIESLRRDDMPAFRKKYRPLDVLMVDDIQFLAGKDRTQEEFFFTFNALYESHKQVILSSDTYPRDMQNIEGRLRSRFESGLIADIEAPDLETKMAILYKKAEFHKKPICPDVAMFIAKNIKSNIRELEGLLLRIIAFASFSHRSLDLDLAKEVLKDFTFDKNRNFTVANIIKTVAEFYNIKAADIKSKRRSREISEPRQIAMYISREHTKLSLPDIGRQFGGKDHTTVIFSTKKIARLITENKELDKAIHAIVKKIEVG